MLKAVVLAGRRNDGKLRAEAPDVAWEALIPIQGHPMTAYVLAAVSSVPEVSETVLVGPGELAAGVGHVVPAGQAVTDSLRAAIQALALHPDGPDELLVVAGDAPLITAAALADFLARCRGRRLQFGYPIVSREDCEAELPGVRRTYVRLREGRFTGGNCFYLQAAVVPRALALLERVYRDRKNPLRLAALFGWSTVLAVALGVASLPALERTGSRLLGGKAGAVPMREAGIGVDVDKPEDLALCQRVLQGRWPLAERRG